VVLIERPGLFRAAGASVADRSSVCADRVPDRFGPLVGGWQADIAPADGRAAVAVEVPGDRGSPPRAARGLRFPDFGFARHRPLGRCTSGCPARTRPWPPSNEPGSPDVLRRVRHGESTRRASPRAAWARESGHGGHPTRDAPRRVPAAPPALQDGFDVVRRSGRAWAVYLARERAQPARRRQGPLGDLAADARVSALQGWWRRGCAPGIVSIHAVGTATVSTTSRWTSLTGAPSTRS
jgi:hypothetical protein